MAKSFYFSTNPISRQAKKHAQQEKALLENLQASIGLQPEHLKQAQAILDATHNTTRATEARGANDFEQLKGERYRLDSIRQDGDVRETLAYREVGGGRVESVIIREERIGERTWVHSETKGLR